MMKISNHLASLVTRRAGIGAAVLLGAVSSPASAATISRSADVQAPVTQVWSLIGPYCAIKDWLPPVGQCIVDGKSPSTRILVTKDGKAAFVEKQLARSEAQHSYSYMFLSSPLPVSAYRSTIKVTATSHGTSRISWSGSYIPERGKEKAASDALNGVYQAGLAEIKRRFAK